MATGNDLTAAIVGKTLLTGINECKGVPARLGMAVYGQWQSDDDPQTIKTNSVGIAEACQFGGTDAQTAVWNFEMINPVHHFVVMPFKGSGGLRYSVLMAYAGKYTLKKYIEGSGNAPDLGGTGYKTRWQGHEFQHMLNTLVSNSAKRQEYFGVAGEASRIRYYKYPAISINTAVANVGAYNLELP